MLGCEYTRTFDSHEGAQLARFNKNSVRASPNFPILYNRIAAVCFAITLQKGLQEKLRFAINFCLILLKYP
jgi:hypothetical protein